VSIKDKQKLSKNKNKRKGSLKMAVKTKSGLAFELVPTSNEQILELDKVLMN